MEPQRRRRIALLLLVGLFATTACTCSLLSNLPQIISKGEQVIEDLPADIDELLPDATEELDAQPGDPASTPLDVTSDDLSLPGLIDSGRIELEGVAATEENTIGPVLEVKVRNPTDEEIVVIIPCGLIFSPSDTSEQRLMTIQESSLTLGPGEQGTMTPYVACIDGDRGIPSQGAAYSVGIMADESLLVLAKCLCNEPLAEQADPSEAIGVQFAVWMTAGGLDMDEFIADMESNEGAMGDVLGDQFGEEMAGLMDLMKSMMMEPAKQYLDKCGIELSESP